MIIQFPLERRNKMTAQEFLDKWSINEKLLVDFNIGNVLKVLDFLYLGYTKEQVIALVSEYYDHADEIYNSYHI